MHKRRPFLFTLLILLTLGLMVYFMGGLTASAKHNTTSIEQETEEILEEWCEAEDIPEEEYEFLCADLPPSQLINIDFINHRSQRRFHAPQAHAAPLACGWIMPLLI